MATVVPQRTVIFICLSVTVIGMLPVFLVGALAQEIKTDLAIGESTIGILVAAFFAVSALTSMPGGRLARNSGWLLAIILVSCSVLLISLVIAWVQLNVVFLGFCLAFAGMANGISQPAANLGIVRSISMGKRGTAFGIKQAATPTATLIAGIALPVVALQFGWRAPFVGLAMIAALVGILAFALRLRVDEGKTPLPKGTREDFNRRPLALLSVGVGFGSAAANTMGAFFVVYALSTGTGPKLAGGLLVAGSVANIIVRLTMGWLADRRSGNHLKVVSYMMFGGSCGIAVLGSAPNFTVLTFGTVAAFGVGWGWNGLLHHGTMLLYSDVAASATSILQTGLFLGAVVGPLAFGFAAEFVSFQVAWLLVALWLALGGLLVVQFRSSHLKRHPVIQGGVANPP